MAFSPLSSTIFSRRVIANAVLAAMLVASAPALSQQAAATVPTSAAVINATPAIVPVGDVSRIPAPTSAAKAWIVIDVNSGQTLAASNPDIKVEPASLTKIMTAYVVFNALDEKRLNLDQQVTVSDTAWRTGGSRMFIEPRKLVTVHELMQGMIVQSGNDCLLYTSDAADD